MSELHTEAGIENVTAAIKSSYLTPSEIANAFWSLWWGANSKPTVDQIEAVQTACKVVEELTGALGINDTEGGS